MKTTKSLLAFIPALALAGTMLHGAGVAGAAPGCTPNNEVGAANMINPHAWTPMWTIAMVHSNDNGSDNMFKAVSITNPNGAVTCS